MKKFFVFSVLLIAGFTLAIIMYLLFFDEIEPSIKQYQSKDLRIDMWNQDNDIHSIEYDFIYDMNRGSQAPKLRDSCGIYYRRPYVDTKKFPCKPGVTKLYIASMNSQRIIQLFNLMQTNNKSVYHQEILLLANWLKKNAQIENDCAKWPYPIQFTKYDLDFGWDGAWALGEHLSAIARCYQMTADTTFIRLGQKIVNTFHTPIEQKGILAFDNQGHYWFEEYPTIPRSSVLNGHINGMLGLFDFWRVTGDSTAKFLFDEGVKTVTYSLPQYDSGYWSYYDHMYNYVTDYKYHMHVHIPQLKVLYQITHNDIFLQYAEKWLAYTHEPYYTFFKLKIFKDALHRRLTYKSW